MIVEFAGLPGSGKTYLRDALANRLSSQGMSVTARHALRGGNRVSALAHRGVSAVRRPALTLSILQATHAAHRPLRERAFALRLSLVTLDNERWAARRNDIFLIDEGFVQRAFLLFAGDPGPPPDDQLRRYLARAPLPDLLVLLDIPTHLVGDRISGRERGLPARFSRLDKGSLQQALEDGASLFDRILALVVAQPRPPRVLRLQVEPGGAAISERSMVALQDAIANIGNGKASAERAVSPITSSA